MFANITWKKFFMTLGVLALMAGFGFAVKCGEDGQVGTDNVLSKSIFIMAGFGALYALGVLAVLDGIHLCYCLGVGGVAADAPHGVGGIEDHTASAHHLHCRLDVFIKISHADDECILIQLAKVVKKYIKLKIKIEN